MIWSSVLVAVGVLGLWLAGGGKKAGWMVGVIAQILWIGYALVTRQYPFIVSALVYGFVYMRNYKKSFTVHPQRAKKGKRAWLSNIARSR